MTKEQLALTLKQLVDIEFEKLMTLHAEMRNSNLPLPSYRTTTLATILDILCCSPEVFNLSQEDIKEEVCNLADLLREQELFTKCGS